MDFITRLNSSLVETVSKFLAPVCLSQLCRTSTTTNKTVRGRLKGLKRLALCARLVRIKTKVRHSDTSSNTSRMQFTHNLELGRLGDKHVLYFRVWLKRSYSLDFQFGRWPLNERMVDLETIGDRPWIPEYKMQECAEVLTSGTVERCRARQEKALEDQLYSARYWRINMGVQTAQDLEWQAAQELWEEGEGDTGDDEGDTSDNQQEDLAMGGAAQDGGMLCTHELVRMVDGSDTDPLRESAWKRLSLPDFYNRLRALLGSGHVLLFDWCNSRLYQYETDEPYHLRESPARLLDPPYHLRGPAGAAADHHRGR